MVIKGCCEEKRKAFCEKNPGEKRRGGEYELSARIEHDEKRSIPQRKGNSRGKVLTKNDLA